VQPRRHERPIVIVGAGLAGLWAAIQLAPRSVVLLTGGARHRSSSSSWAQGGIAAALGNDDDPSLHLNDTVEAGAGLVDLEAARMLTADAPAEVERLAAIGVPFERDAQGGWMLSREAAHRVARVGGDGSGAAIVRTLDDHVRLLDSVQRIPATGCALLNDEHGRCCGMVIESEDGKQHRLSASAVILATGGVGGLYSVSTNPGANQGQSLAWAARLGARIRDAEFVQFHPTALDVGQAPAPLATEALRGEGATLVDRAGRRFMMDLHPDAELAPRDVVARAVHRQRRSGGAWLDIRSIDELEQRFPFIVKACRDAGIDPRQSAIPVAPAAHYHMGGVATDLDGRSDVERLWVIGEAACTGVHGANRLASNSLLEAVVMARRAADALRDNEFGSHREGNTSPTLGETRLPARSLQALRTAMQQLAGVERDHEGLDDLVQQIDRLEDEHGTSDALIAARAVAESAQARTESRGAHYRTDHPLPIMPPRHSHWRAAAGSTVTERSALTPETQP
jgi:L-aspartate oxidase